MSGLGLKEDPTFIAFDKVDEDESCSYWQLPSTRQIDRISKSEAVVASAVHFVSPNPPPPASRWKFLGNFTIWLRFHQRTTFPHPQAQAPNVESFRELFAGTGEEQKAVGNRMSVIWCALPFPKRDFPRVWTAFPAASTSAINGAICPRKGDGMNRRPRQNEDEVFKLNSKWRRSVFLFAWWVESSRNLASIFRRIAPSGGEYEQIFTDFTKSERARHRGHPKTPSKFIVGGNLPPFLEKFSLQQLLGCGLRCHLNANVTVVWRCSWIFAKGDLGSSNAWS